MTAVCASSLEWNVNHRPPGVTPDSAAAVGEEVVAADRGGYTTDSVHLRPFSGCFSTAEPDMIHWQKQQIVQS